MAIFSLQTINAQSSKVSTAYFLMSDYKESKSLKDLMKAKEAIDVASKHETTSLQGKTWYYSGLIYNLLSKNEITKADGTDYSSISIASLTKAITINDKKFREDAKVIQLFRELSVNSFNEGVEFYKVQNFKSSYTKFISTVSTNKLIIDHGEVEPVSTITAIEYSAISASNAGMDNEAIDSYEKLMKLDNVGNHYFNLAKLYKKVGNEASYKETLEKGSVAFPDDANIIIEQLNILIKAGKTADAIDKIDKAIELQPENDMLYFVKGNTLETAGQVDEALKLYEKATEVNPKNDKALYNIGAVHFKKANKLIEEMNKLGMEPAEIKKYDALNAERKNIYRKAKPYFEKVLELVPGDAVSKKALNKINSTLE